MIFFVKIVGIIFIMKGVVTIFYPKTFLVMLIHLRRGRRLLCIEIGKVFFGVFLVLSSSACRYRPFVLGIGLLSLISGLWGILMGDEKLKKICHWGELRSEILVRFLGMAAVILGIFFIYVS